VPHRTRCGPRGSAGDHVVTLHDLNLAAAFCDLRVVLSRGAVVAAGPPVEVLIPALIERV
jgi:iron complex transport system ATP-binding protein